MDQPSNIGQQAQERMREMGEYVRDRASDVRNRLQEQIPDQARGAFAEYPLAVGATFFTLGLAFGLVLPFMRGEEQESGGRWRGRIAQRVKARRSL